MKIKTPALLAAGLLFALAFILPTPKAGATSLSYTLTIDSSCTSFIDGASSTTASVVTGSTSNVTVENNDNIVSQSVSGPGIQTTLSPNNKTSSGTATFQLGNVTSQEVITFTPIPNSTNPFPEGNNCYTGSNPNPVASTLIINPIAPTPSPTVNTTPIPTTTTPTDPTPKTDSTTAPTSTTAPETKSSALGNDPSSQVIDTLATKPKSAWSKPLIIGLSVLGVLVVAALVYKPSRLKLKRLLSPKKSLFKKRK